MSLGAKLIESKHQVRSKNPKEEQKKETENEHFKPNPNLLGDIVSFKKDDLKETETHETHSLVIQPTTSYGHSTEEEIKEYYDSPKELERKVKVLANFIRESKYMVVYTGAGVSTSAKIPDYRGPNGVWTLRDKGMEPKMEIKLEQAIPTSTHMAIVEFEKKGIMKYLVSTNVDGLHRRAGTSAAMIAELHGNCYKELCEICGMEYLQSFDVAHGGANHKTGRTCDVNGCNGERIDSIINFGESLPTKEIQLTQMHADNSDVALVLGTSMRVQPACLFPVYSVRNGGKMVIVNLQKTPFDDSASLLIREKTDKVIEMLFKELEMNIPTYDEQADIINLMKNGCKT